MRMGPRRLQPQRPKPPFGREEQVDLQTPRKEKAKARAKANLRNLLYFGGDDE